MLCAIYKSLKKDETYLYLAKKDDFSRVPEALMTMFGKPQLALVINLAQKKQLVRADIDKVKKALDEDGFFLQLPPPPINYLEQHKAQQKKDID
ncbi:YcgL domain-containing protein [Motilimonas eburnea]|uniref:YcgL domain-containing protein n=1 Tax=Motilimonas eburnea TaxID=1737488 RepID=UPI001E479C06|nr:YcgL domain-containing protein [Motilimonas eburnea]MCE2571913.1 YcgL domain-containing protein [Motilimonas eburnea]